MGTEDKYQFIHHKSRIVDPDSAGSGFSRFFKVTDPNPVTINPDPQLWSIGILFEKEKLLSIRKKSLN